MNFGTLLILLYNSYKITDVRTLLQHVIQVPIRPHTLNYKLEVSNSETSTSVKRQTARCPHQ